MWSATRRSTSFSTVHSSSRAAGRNGAADSRNQSEASKRVDFSILVRCFCLFVHVCSFFYFKLFSLRCYEVWPIRDLYVDYVLLNHVVQQFVSTCYAATADSVSDEFLTELLVRLLHTASVIIFLPYWLYLQMYQSMVIRVTSKIRV